MQGLYINIPFCISKCVYCDFASFAGIKRLRMPYLKALKREIALQKKHYKNFDPRTLYVGGGTPSFLTSLPVPGVIGWFVPEILDFPSGKRRTLPPALII